MPKKKEDKSFSQNFKELETIVIDFESRELDLEKDLPQFERGLKLAGSLQKQLKEIENKVKTIENKFTEKGNEE